MPTWLEDWYSECDMCDRHMKLTFHHLVPKSTHSHYIKKRRVPGNLTIPNFDAKFDIAGFLHAYGVYMCRPCHSAIHRCIPNKDLAEEYNSRERLMDVNKIRAWAEFNGGTKVKTKVKTGEK